MRGVRTGAKKSVRLQIVEALGGRCQWHGGCDVADPDMLHVEHKNGDGNKERAEHSRLRGINTWQNAKRIGTGDSSYYTHILEHLHTGNYQLLCANHHSKKTAIDRRCKKWEGEQPCPFAEVTSA